MPYLARPLLFALPPETAHRLAMRALQCKLALNRLVPPPQAGARSVMGLHFANPIGLAAGFDKDAAHIDALATLGFGFIEVGGVTPQAQPGNPLPRVFRLPPAQALINRMGLNSIGAAGVAANLARRRYRGIVAINIGKNAATPNAEAVQDYLSCLRTLYAHGDFFVVNVSSPNTPHLRDLQQTTALRHLLDALRGARDELAAASGKRAPLALKISPDMSDEALRDIAEVANETGIEGVVAVNTTTARNGVSELTHSTEEGGLSGRPLAARATQVVRVLRATLKPDIAIIGVGGIDSVAAAQERFAAGADLLQIYTGLIYQGISLPRQLIYALRARGE